MQQNEIDAFCDLLDQERDAIIAGHLDRLPNFSDRKINAFDTLKSQDAASRHIKIAQDRLTRNATLLKAAIDGVQAAQSRIAALDDVHKTLRVYSADGQISPHVNATSTLNKQS